MKKIQLFFALLLFISCKGSTQEQDSSKEMDTKVIQPSDWSEVDSVLFHNFPDTLQRIADWARFFLETPYQAATLEEGDDLKCVINLREFDCTTFVENVVALHSLDTLNQNDFAERLIQLRYRSGKMVGYSSRLHYFSEWIVENVQKGFVTDITKQLGGVAIEKPLNFMSTHRASYPALKDSTFYEAIQGVEAKLSNRVRYVLPKENLQAHEDAIEEGDIIGLATNIKGLDFVHLGFATRNVTTGRVHLLHASSSEKKVVVSTETLTDYLQKSKNVSGIVILRIRKNKK